MKGLLHSKRFKKNLYKWIFMYIMTIGLFTSVVTYSKYISSMETDATTRVASFDVDITYAETCTELTENEICNLGSFRPTSNISYYFNVDTRGLEVTSLFVIRITVLDVFKNVKIYDVTDTKTEIEFTNNNNVFTLTRELKPNETDIRKYQVTMDFDYENYDNTLTGNYPFSNAVSVGYSATQIK